MSSDPSDPDLGSVAAATPSQPVSLVELLRTRAQERPDQRVFTLLQDGEEETAWLTYADLDLRARALGAWLQESVASGERALLLYPTGLEFIVAFMACLYAGVVAVPVYASRSPRMVSRFQALLESCRPALVLTQSDLLSKAQSLTAAAAEPHRPRVVTTDDLEGGQAQRWSDPKSTPDSLAYLQYTSGSTSLPKGVMVSHANVLANQAMLRQVIGGSPSAIFVSWLPLYHDLGLVATLLRPIYLGAQCVLMPPVSFLRQPRAWLSAISRYGGTTSGGPNFAYDLCVNKISPQERVGLDLSSWKYAYNGAEPVHAETLARFTAAFGPHGFEPGRLVPTYGLAEVTLFAAGDCSQRPVIETVDGRALERGQVVVGKPTAGAGRPLVSCGRVAPGSELVIVDPDSGAPCPPNRVGEIWIAGPHVARGYWEEPEATDRMFRARIGVDGKGPFLRTGDLGFLREGQLFVTGRIKDLIIIRGRNVYPQDVELVVAQSHPTLRSGCGAAFSVEVEGEERLVVVQETRAGGEDELDTIVEGIRRTVWEEFDLQPYSVVLVSSQTIAKTSSGKIQRHACRQAFLDGGLTTLHRWEEQPRTVTLPGATGSAADKDEPGTVPRHLGPGHRPSTPELESSRQRADAAIAWLRGYAEERLDSRLMDERRSIPPHVILDLGNRGLLGILTPRALGGLELSTGDAMRVFQQLAAIDLTLASFVSGHNCLGIRPIELYARDALRDEILPLLASGRELAALALTEEGAGSDPRAMAATATPESRGGWLLRGKKIWSSTASWSGVVNVFAHVTGAGSEAGGITGFVVRQGTPGLSLGPESLTMGLRGMVQSSLHLEDVAVRETQLLGGVGQGMEIAGEMFSFARLVLGASSVGGMKRCAQLMLRYADRRSVATGRLLENPLTLERMSAVTAAITAMETLVTRTAESFDTGEPVPLEVAMASKIAGSELLWRAADSLVQVLGGRGYMEPNFAPQLLRDARLFRIFEGPTEPLLMFLGGRAAAEDPKLPRLLSDGFGAARVSESLQEAVAGIKARPPGGPAGLPDTVRRGWATACMGEVTVWSFLWAAVEGARDGAQSQPLLRAGEWARLGFERALAKALSGTPAEAVMLDANALQDWVSTYTATIGDVEPRLPGEDSVRDPMLRRHDRGQPRTAAGGEAETSPRAASAPETAASQASGAEAVAALVSEATGPTVEAIEGWLINQLTQKANVEPEAIDRHKNLSTYGLDSVTAVMLIDDLGKWLGRALSPDLPWAYPSIEELARHLALTASAPGPG